MNTWKQQSFRARFADESKRSGCRTYPIGDDVHVPFMQLPLDLRYLVSSENTMDQGVHCDWITKVSTTTMTLKAAIPVFDAIWLGERSHYSLW